MLTHGECVCRLRGALLAAACAVGAALAAGLCENRFGALPDAGSKFADPALLAFGFISMPGALQPLAAAAAVVLAACVPHGAGLGRLRAALGSRALARLADLSYGIFLLHPLARCPGPVIHDTNDALRCNIALSVVRVLPALLCCLDGGPVCHVCTLQCWAS